MDLLTVPTPIRRPWISLWVLSKEIYRRSAHVMQISRASSDEEEYTKESE